MELAKIIVKSNYEKKGDLVFRPLIRMLNKCDLSGIVNDNETIILGLVQDDIFYEFTTWKPIHNASYKIISMEEFNCIIDNISVDNLHQLRTIINAMVFNKNDNINFDASMIEDLAKDRGIEFNAYNQDLSNINPYEEPYDGYNDFLYKCKKLKK